MKRTFLIFLLLSSWTGAQAQLKGTCDTTFFSQAAFEWHVTPRHDYSRTLMGKLFLSQAHYDEQFKLRDNGRQTVYMDCSQALEAIKAMDAITLGLPKIIYLVGWQYNGHDSKYPAFFECNEAIKSPGDSSAYESILNLMEEAKKHHTSVSFHINMFNCYDDSPLFEKYKEDDVLARYERGDYVHSDWGWTVSYARDWATGNAQARLDKLCELFPIADSGTLHIDAFHSDVPVPVIEGDEVVIRYMSPISPYHKLTKEDEINAQLNIIKYLDAKGIDVTSEYCPDEVFCGYMPAVWHKNEKHLFLTRTERQIAHTNSWDLGDVFGRNVNSEEAFRFGGDTMEEKAEAFKKAFCKNSLPYFYLSQLTPVAYLTDSLDNSGAIFANGVKTSCVDGKFSMYNDDVEMASDGNCFIPAGWVGDNVVIAYSEDGYDSHIWTLPQEVKAGRTAKIYAIDSKGSHYLRTAKVRNRRISLTLKKGEMLEIIF